MKDVRVGQHEANNRRETKGQLRVEVRSGHVNARISPINPFY